jgi:hypothetical protein
MAKAGTGAPWIEHPVASSSRHVQLSTLEAAGSMIGGSSCAEHECRVSPENRISLLYVRLLSGKIEEVEKSCVEHAARRPHFDCATDEHSQRRSPGVSLVPPAPIQFEDAGFHATHPSRLVPHRGTRHQMASPKCSRTVGAEPQHTALAESSLGPRGTRRRHALGLFNREALSVSDRGDRGRTR